MHLFWKTLLHSSSLHSLCSTHIGLFVSNTHKVLPFCRDFLHAVLMTCIVTFLLSWMGTCHMVITHYTKLNKWKNEWMSKWMNYQQKRRKLIEISVNSTERMKWVSTNVLSVKNKALIITDRKCYVILSLIIKTKTLRFQRQYFGVLEIF